MSWLCWNVHGLGNLHTLRELEVVTRAQDPAAMFLAEMWAEEARLHRLCFNMKFDHCWVGPSAGKTRCLVLLWKNSVHVEVVSSSPNHINTLVGVNPVDQWRFTRVYGYANSTRKQETWSLLCCLHHKYTFPWLCAGDFNELLWSHEKLGLGPRQDSKMKEFRDVLDECGLMDLGYTRDKFTWKGKRADGLDLERLDRAIASNEWFSHFPGTKVQHLLTHSSDHKAILIKLGGITPCLNRPFKFEQMWLREGVVIRWLRCGAHLPRMQIFFRLPEKLKLVVKSSLLGVFSLLAILNIKLKR